MRRTQSLALIIVGLSAIVGCGGEPYDEDLEGEEGIMPYASGRLSSTEVARYAKSAGIPCGERLRVAVAVAYAESGYNPRAYNKNRNGTVDKGLWQINTYYHPPSCDYYNPTCNARQMARISSGGANWGPWYGHGTSNYWTAYRTHAKEGAANACNGSASSSSPSSSSSSLVFNAAYYLGLYGDLRAAFGSNAGAARTHWETYGIREGRRASRVFHVKDYLRRHADLRAAFGATNYRAALTHWLTYGIKEGRQSAANFSVRAYLGRYADLRRAFGTNYRAAFEHYLRYGYREGRNARP